MSTTPTITRRAAVLVSATLLVACSGTPEPQDLTVGLVDYAFEGLPGEFAAGSTVSIDNQSEAELHELVAVRLPDGEERPGEELVALPREELETLTTDVAVVQLQPPGSPDVIEAAGDGTITEPGRYLFACFIPTGIDPDVYLEAAALSEGGPPEVEGGGPPHFVNGMWAVVDVVE